MAGPCLCGDTACGSCHPEGQSHVSCPDCGWAGRAHDAGFASDEDSAFDLPGACPDCGGTLVSAELEEIEAHVEEEAEEDNRSQDRDE